MNNQQTTNQEPNPMQALNLIYNLSRLAPASAQNHTDALSAAKLLESLIFEYNELVKCKEVNKYPETNDQVIAT